MEIGPLRRIHTQRGAGISSLRRIRWRRRGAWLWPAFVAVILVDAFVGHALPPAGETENVLGAAISGCVLTLVAVVVLTRPLSALLRRIRADLPVVVARNYAGTGVVVCVTGGLLAAGLVHRHAILAHQRVMEDAVSRAEAWIGDRAPATFRRNVRSLTAFAIEPGSIYRMCVSDQARRRSYCVVVKTNLPFGESVSFDGYEPNTVFAQGAG